MKSSVNFALLKYIFHLKRIKSFKTVCRQSYFNSAKCSIFQYYIFLYWSPFSFSSSNFPIDWFMASFMYCFPCNSNCCHCFTLLNAIAKSSIFLLLSPLRAIKSNNYCYRDSWKSDGFKGEKSSKELIPKMKQKN